MGLGRSATGGGRAARGFLLGGRHVGLRVRILRDLGVVQVVLQRAEVASQLLAGLGDGRAEGRRISVAVLLAVACYGGPSFPAIWSFSHEMSSRRAAMVCAGRG